MPKGDHKAQKAKARQQAIRKQKAQVTAQPRILRENPGLGAALALRHPLVGYFINKDWADTKIASVHCIRTADDGQVVASFLVDTAWQGTTDCYGESGLGDALGEWNNRLADAADLSGKPALQLVPVDAALAINLIRGGIAWARQQRRSLPNNLDLWLRAVDPLPPAGPDLRVFGDGQGKPVIADDRDELLLGDELLDDEIVWADEDEWDAEDDGILEGEILAPAPPALGQLSLPPAWQPRRRLGQ